MKYLVEFTEFVTTKRQVKAILEAKDIEYIKGVIEDRDYEVEDCYNCYDVDWKLDYINSAEPYDKTMAN